MKKIPLYQAIARLFGAYERCVETNNQEWKFRRRDRITELVQHQLPSGSGFDNGTKFLFEDSKPEKLVFYAPFHHMNDVGMYDGWTEHNVVVTPSLESGFDLKVTGRDKRDIKDYIAETFHQALGEEVDEYEQPKPTDTDTDTEAAHD